MKKEELAELTDSQKIDYLITKIDKLDKAINPPWWKRGVKWSANHWIFVVGFVSMGWALWHMWDEIQMLIKFVQGINESMESVKSSVSGITDTTGKVTNTITDTVKDTFKGWNFWE